MKLAAVILLLLSSLSWTSGINILFIENPLDHDGMLVDFLTENLVSRKHTVEVLNLVAISSEPVSVLSSQITSGLSFTDENSIGADSLAKLSIIWCEAALKFLNTTKVMVNKHYHLAIVDPELNYCAYPLLAKADVPVVSLVPANPWLGPYSWLSCLEPLAPAVVPAYGVSFPGGGGGLADRLDNYIKTAWACRSLKSSLIYPVQEVVDRFTETEKPILEAMGETGATLVYSDFTIDFPRPLPPNTVMVGGYHCHAPQPLDDAVEKWFSADGSDGVVVVTLDEPGLDEVPDSVSQVLAEALGSIRLRVAWTVPRLEHQTLTKLKNFRVVDPNHTTRLQNLIGHTRTRLVVTSGAQTNLVEGVCHGVPLLVLPLSQGHRQRAAKLVSSGVAHVLDTSPGGNFSAAALVDAIKELVYNPSHKDAALQASIQLRDQPLSAINRAIYWTEFVARHRGAAHISVPGGDSLYMDVLLTAAATSALAVLLACLLTRLCRGGDRTQNTKGVYDGPGSYSSRSGERRFVEEKVTKRVYEESESGEEDTTTKAKSTSAARKRGGAGGRKTK